MSLIINLPQLFSGKSNFRIRSLGVWFELHGPNDLPFLGTKDGITLPPGTRSNIRFQLSTMKRLPKPYGKCKDTERMYIEKYNISINSHFAACTSLCLETAVLNQCGCVDARLSIVWHKANESHPYCGDIKLPPEKVKQFMNCALRVRLLQRKHCMKNCPIACHSVLYKSSVSHSAWPGYNYHQSFYQRIIRNSSF